jgi:AcrR family transcriptional regulator
MRKTVPALSLASQLKIAERVREAFLRRGFNGMTMVVLAEECGLTRRGLYYYFSSKEEAFLATIRLENTESLESGRRAAQKALIAKGNALEAIAAWIDARYGHTRRNLSRSEFAQEINNTAFRLCNDVMDEFAIRTHDDLAELLRELQKSKLLHMENPASAKRVARLLADGARGVNQTRPPISNAALPGRYREMCAAILYGVAKAPAK